MINYRIDIPIILLVAMCFFSCKQSSKNKNNTEIMDRVFFEKGTFGFDREFLQKHYKKTLVLESADKKSSIILSPELQGRVMTSTLNGDEGMSFGWLNYDLISSKEIMKHINATGGEERFWLGPEGGQFSIYFKKGTQFEFENWYVPAGLDTEEFYIAEKTKNSVIFKKELHLTNYSGTKFNLMVTRKISLLAKKQIAESLNVSVKDLSSVAYETQNIVKNIGPKAWQKETGLLSIWLLSMMIPSSEVTVIVPINKGTEEKLGLRVNDNYFGSISSDRLKTTEENVFFKADGESRGKIGISAARSMKYMGSYDAHNKILTILEIKKPNQKDPYVNSAWEFQKKPYSGDALNSYNDGKMDDGSQLGPFYELESSSPALALDSGSTFNHTQKIYHFKGNHEQINNISQKILHVSIADIENAF